MTIEEGEQRAKELAVMFIETSAKSSYNVKQVVMSDRRLHLHSYSACVRLSFVFGSTSAQMYLSSFV